MPRHRLFVPLPISRNQYLEIDGEQAHYLSRVLRMKVGSELTIFEGNGYEYPAVVTELRKKKAVLRAGEPRLENLESALSVRLVQGVSRGERMDFVVQKATELGVQRIQPVISEFTVVKLDAGRARRRVQHWERVAQSACEQCGRNRVPDIAMPLTLNAYLALGSDADRRLAFLPGAGTALREVAGPIMAIDLLVGSEGGLSEREREDARRAGFIPISLGPRILRSESAAMAAVALVQGRWGDLQA